VSGLRPRPGILDIKPYTPGKSSVGGRVAAMKVSANESAFGPSPKAIEAFRSAAGTLHRYPDGGSVALRAAIGARHGLDVDRIVCGAGSDELIYNLVRGYAGPDDEVLYSEHGFNVYPIAALSVGARPVTAPETNLTFDVDAILAAVTGKTRIVFIANPNNPTGSYIPADELARLRAGLRPDILLVIDAAYAEYVVRNDYTTGEALVDGGDNTVMTRTFSKIYGLAALRIGWGYCPPAIADVLNRIRGPFNLGTAAQAAGIAALEDTAHVAASRDHNSVWLPWLADRLAGLGLTVYPSAANFILVRFPAGKARSASAAMAYLGERGIIPRETAVYGLPDCLRITIGREDEVRAVARAVEDFIDGR
jgi:histidinol-phosphate aminotransferase